MKNKPLLKLGCTYESELTGNLYVPTHDFFRDSSSKKRIQRIVCLRFISAEFVEYDHESRLTHHFQEAGEDSFVTKGFTKHLKLKKDYNHG